MILIDNDYIAIKLRLPDKNKHLSKKDGYRLIYLVSKVSDNVIFLDIYPKTGPSQQIDIPDSDLTILLNTFAKESKEGLLIEFQIQ